MKFKGFIFVLASEIELGLGSQKEVVAPALNIETRDLRFFGSLSYAIHHKARALTPPDPPALWQDCWGFRGLPVDRPSRGKPENRSPAANSLRTC